VIHLNHKTIHPAIQRRYASLQETAVYMGVTDRTVRQWIAEGRITGYRINARLIRVDLNEVDSAMVPFGGGVQR
jgi:excisionase family DNA binding protein